jgi:hypothetical protein
MKKVSELSEVSLTLRHAVPTLSQIRKSSSSWNEGPIRSVRGQDALPANFLAIDKHAPDERNTAER